MKTITVTEFRANQKKYLEMAEKTPIILTRGNEISIKITRFTEDDLIEEYAAKIQEGIQQGKDGKVVTFNSLKEFKELLKPST